MELKDIKGLEARIREWAGNEATIELKYNTLASCTNPFYVRIANDKVCCIVNIDKPDEPYGLFFVDDEVQWETIKGFFKDGKK